MAFLSQLVKKPVADIDGNLVGVLKDVIARQWGGLGHPVIEAVSVQTRAKDPLLVPYSALGMVAPSIITLKGRVADVPAYSPAEDDIQLAGDVLDKQIIDTNGARLVRVNDVELVRVNDSLLVSNIDVGNRGLLRRIGLEKPVQQLLALIKKDLASSYISWDNVEMVSRDQSTQLRVPVTKISDLHPADVAEILGELNQFERDQVLEQMDIKQFADALEEVEPEFQVSLLEHMPDEKIGDVLEEMAPDEAADLLAGMDKARSEDLLSLMRGEEAADVRSLLSYPEDTAGGIMTTEYVTVRADMTAAEAIQSLRENASEAETIFYVYVTGEAGRLLGVISLKRLILADPQAPVASFMTRRATVVYPLTGQDEVARLISKYDLLAIPVIDPQERLLGIVTSDDALDKIIPTAWKKRLPRIFS